MKTYKQTWTVKGEVAKLGSVKTTTRNVPLKDNDRGTLALAREMYGEQVKYVALDTTDIS